MSLDEDLGVTRIRYTKGTMGTIIKHGDGWRAVIRKKGHPTKTKVFTKQALAKVWVKDIEHAMEKRELTSSHVSIPDLIDRYLREIEPLKPGEEQNRKNYRTLERNVKGMTLEDLNAAGLLDWVQKKRSGASKATISMDLTMMTAVLRTAEAFWAITVPWREMQKGRLALRRLGMVGKSQERSRRPEGDELDRIKAKLRSTLPMVDLIDFACDTAMRSAEVTRLRWSDLNEEKRTILIRDRKHPNQKIGNDQVVPLLGASFEIIMRQPKVDDLIFPVNSKSVETAFQRARRAAGIVGLRYHDLRHHGISKLFEQGYAIQEVAMVSGHRDWNQLRRYTNLKPESLHTGPVKKQA